MDRTIKFRGKSIYGEDWLYSSLVKIEEDRYAVIPSLNDIEIGKSISMYEVCLETIGQFTGLYDKNGKEIYEGDIIKGFDIIIEVWYSEDTACFMAEMKEPQNDMVDILGGYDTARMEIIANIYDHPELIKEK
jgi:uncharacterized phage protein (TIGR01671 family)